MSSRVGKVNDVGRRYVEDSTTGGVRRAARPGIVLRVIWVIVIIGCIVVTGISLARLRDVRSDRQRSLTSRHVAAHAQDFPAVTVCNVNPVATLPTTVGYGRRQQEVSKEESGVLMELQSLFEECQELGTSVNSRDFRVRYAALVEKLSAHTKEAIGHSLADMLVGCHLGEVSCDRGNFTQFYHETFGNCFTFVPGPAYQTIWKGGAEHGLTLNLNTDSDPSTLESTLESASGFVVAVHRSRDTVFLEEEGVFVPEGKAAYIALSKSKDQSVDDDCDDDAGEIKSRQTNIYAVETQWRYSRRGCQHGCLQRELYRQCGCCELGIPCPASFINPDLLNTMTTTAATTTAATTTAATTTTVTTTTSATDPLPSRKKREADVAVIPRCNDTHSNCSQDVLREYSASAMSCLVQCLPRCSRTKYSTRLSLTTLKAQNEAPLPPITEGSGMEQFTGERLQSKQESASFKRRKRNVTPNNENTRIHVYFEQLGCRLTESTTAPSTDWSEWMADIGGVTSLWLGLSVMGLLEILQTLLELAVVAFSKCCGGSPVKPIAPSSTEA